MDLDALSLLSPMALGITQALRKASVRHRHASFCNANDAITVATYLVGFTLAADHAGTEDRRHPRQ